MDLILEDVLKLVLALVLGGMIGAEREFRDKAAGFRTIIFICVGAALFTLISAKMGEGTNETRIAAQIVSGVGFLGAGVIMRDMGRVTGLTTAATIWLAAAIGMSIGSEEYGLGIVTTALALMVLMFFPAIERWIENRRDFRAYEVISPMAPGRYEELDALFTASGLKIHDRKRYKSGDDMICTWLTHGLPKEHQKVMDELFEHPSVKKFTA
jgi:putative Mg2+ transporter-C (MgtC) family protein